MDGFEPPYVEGSDRPKLSKPAQKQLIGGHINPAYLVELRDIAINFNTEWQNYYGRQWSGFKDQIKIITEMAKQAGIDLSSYAPETFSLSDVKEVDDVMRATETMLKDLSHRIETSHEIGLRLIPNAKKKRWAKTLRRAISLQRKCRDPIPETIRKRSKEVQEVWKNLHTLRYMLWTTRSHLMTTDGSQALMEVPPHLVEACLVMKIAENDGPALGIKGVLIVFAPRHGKPCGTSTYVLMADGTRKTLGEIEVGDFVITHRGRPREVVKVHIQGKLPVRKITTASGRETIAALDHPFLTTHGWKEAKDLKPGMVLLNVPHPATSTEYHSPEECRLAGYFVGDGTCKQALITNKTPSLQKDIQHCAASLGFDSTLSFPKNNTPYVGLKAGVRPWLRDVGLAGKTSYTKRVPDFIFRCNQQGIANFLGAYFDCDGTINKRGGARKDHCVEFNSVSKDLLQDVQHLLLRVGIQSTLRLRRGQYKGETHLSWRLSFSSQHEVAKFLRTIPLHSYKEQTLREWDPQLQCIEGPYLSDKIQSVFPVEDHECRCLEVDDDHTFTADDLVVHNTTLVTCDAALDICVNPHLNAGIIHNAFKHAQSRYYVVRDHFTDTDVGRRRRALFPHIEMEGSLRDNAARLFVTTRGKRVNIHQEGNFSPWGVHSRAQGLTFHKLTFDDPSDEKEQTEEGTRERTNNAIKATWISRLTGLSSFFKYICTRWHPEDFAGELLDLHKRGDLKLAYYTVSCGGPEEDFRPVWEQSPYTADFLRQAFARLGPANYSCQYQNDPDSAAARRVQNLHFYDYKEWTQPEARSEAWKKFFADPSTTYYLSIDPAGTASRTSNLAGVTYAAFGNLSLPCPDGSTMVVPKVAFLNYWSDHMGQHDVAKLAAKIHNENKVDKILVESTSGFHATAEALIVVENIPAEKVIKRPPGTGSKVERLMKRAIHLENGDVVFPGEWMKDEHGDKALQVVPQWTPVALQILRAGTTKDDNLLDCVRQQLDEISPDIYLRKGLTPPQKVESPERTRRREFYEGISKTNRERLRLARQGRTAGRSIGRFTYRKYVDSSNAPH